MGKLHIRSPHGINNEDFSFNVRGLCYKKQQIIDLINKNNINIFCLQESHLINSKDLQIIEKTTNSIFFLQFGR